MNASNPDEKTATALPFRALTVRVQSDNGQNDLSAPQLSQPAARSRTRTTLQIDYVVDDTEFARTQANASGSSGTAARLALGLDARLQLTVIAKNTATGDVEGGEELEVARGQQGHRGSPPVTVKCVQESLFALCNHRRGGRGESCDQCQQVQRHREHSFRDSPVLSEQCSEQPSPRLTRSRMAALPNLPALVRMRPPLQPASDQSPPPVTGPVIEDAQFGGAHQIPSAGSNGAYSPPTSERTHPRSVLLNRRAKATATGRSAMRINRDVQRREETIGLGPVCLSTDCGSRVLQLGSDYCVRCADTPQDNAMSSANAAKANSSSRTDLPPLHDALADRRFVSRTPRSVMLNPCPQCHRMIPTDGGCSACHTSCRVKRISKGTRGKSKGSAEACLDSSEGRDSNSSAQLQLPRVDLRSSRKENRSPGQEAKSSDTAPQQHLLPRPKHAKVRFRRGRCHSLDGDKVQRQPTVRQSSLDAL